MHPHTGPTPRVRSPRRFWKRHEFWAVPLFALLAAALVFWDAQEKAKSVAAPGRLKDYSYGDRVVDTLQAFTGGIPNSNDNVGGTYIFGRYLAVAIALYATLRVVTAVYGDRVRAWRASRRSGHTVVAGLSESGVRAVRTYAPHSTVLAVTRTPLSAAADEAVARGASVVWGDPRTPGGLRGAGIEGARRLICSEDTEEGSYETALVALRLRKNGPGALPLRIYVAGSGGDVAGALTDLGLIPHGVSVESFDLHDLWARRLVEAGPLWRYRYGNEPPPTLVLLGTGRLAQALLLEAARWWHFGAPESQLTSDLRIRVVASDAEAVCAAFRSRYPASTRTVSLEPLALDPLQPADVDAIPVAPPATPWGAYVCVDADDAYRLMVADRYGARVGDRHDGAIVVAISALGVASEAPTAQLSLTVPDRPPIVGLGVDDRGGLDVEHLGRTEALARTIHGDYEGFMRDKGWTDAPALAPFDSLEERFRESNRRQARDFDAQLTACLLRTTRLVDWDRVKDFDPAAVEVMAALEHASWVEERLVGGWHLGPVRDDDAKQHPDIVDWSALADARREIDREFIRRRPHVLARIGEQAVPHPARAVLARLLHERYRTTTGDERGWDALPDEDRAASLAFVDAIPMKLLMIGRHIVERDGESPLHALREDEIELLAQAEHERWAAFRARRGWRLGSRRDESARAHPDLLPWSELPDDVREIDRELIRAMPASLEVVGLATRRIPTVPGLASSHRPS